MTGEAPDDDDKETGDPTSATLHTMAVNLAAMQRLLGRQPKVGTLAQADPALLAAAIALGREEVRHVRTVLAQIPQDPTDPWRRTADDLIATLAELDGVLDALEKMLGHLSG
ncbi:hypothetical protein [Methylobacterium sp. J-070]|uniref:hypothetical protein n=1 Tax=Methylobacterium sp. J-070 TaxID=2836650 RepID=UPI001FBB6FD1|nr:hypothetical protein [Methylobacterium sp. J-070]MCJ2054775.1 hypothetical protein [Methylobacterium sp. J-070]